MKSDIEQQDMSSPAFPRQRGFTLVEMMITMAVIAVLLAVGVPSMSNYSASRAVRAQVSLLATTMRLARSEAVKRGTRVTVCASNNPQAAAPDCDGGADWESGWVMFSDRGAAGTLDAGDQVVRVQAALDKSGGVTSSVNTVVTFLPSGISMGGQRRYAFLPIGKTDADPSDFALGMCQSASGGTRLIKYSETC